MFLLIVWNLPVAIFLSACVPDIIQLQKPNLDDGMLSTACDPLKSFIKKFCQLFNHGCLILEFDMKRWFSNSKHVLLLSLCVAVIGASVLLVGFKRPDDDYFFKINKSIDIFGRVYREV